MVARPEQARDAARACGKQVEVVALVNDDLWIRDMGRCFWSTAGAGWPAWT